MKVSSGFGPRSALFRFLLAVGSVTAISSGPAVANDEHGDAVLEREDLGTSLLFRPTSPTAASVMGQLLCQCPGCQPKRITIRDCACGYAARQREEVLAVLGGHALSSATERDQAERDVLADQVARYGRAVLVDPQSPTPWAIPLIAMVSGLGIVMVIGRRRLRGAGRSRATMTTVVPLDDVLVERLDDELALVD